MGKTTLLKIRKGFGRVAVCGFGLLVVLFFVPSNVYSQITARGLGMGGAYTALARGVHAQSWNPANLGLPDNSKFSMTFISVEAGVWNNSFSKEMYDKYNGAVWDEDDIKDILDHIPSKGLDLDVQAFVRSMSFSVGRFALSFGVRAGSYVRVDKTFFEIPLQGNELNQEYSLSDTEGEGLGLGVVGLSWGQPVNVSFAKAFAVGGTLNLLYGVGYGHLDKAEFTLNTATTGFKLDGEYEVKYALPVEDGAGNIGMGWGLDLGAAAQIGDRWTVSLALANIYSSLPWSEGVKKEAGYVRGDSLNVVNLTEKEDEENAIEDSSWTIEGGRFTSKLPTILRLGCAYQEGTILLSADYSQGFENGVLASTTPQFAFGAEWKGLSWLPLRLGLVMGGKVGFGTAFGLGIRPGGFVLDLGVLNRGFALPKKSKGVIAAIELGIDLQREKSETLKVGDF